MSIGEMLLGRVPGHEIKKTSVSKREKKDQAFKPSSCLETAEQEDRGKAASLNWEALV